MSIIVQMYECFYIWSTSLSTTESTSHFVQFICFYIVLMLVQNLSLPHDISIQPLTLKYVDCRAMLLFDTTFSYWYITEYKGCAIDNRRQYYTLYSQLTVQFIL